MAYDVSTGKRLKKYRSHDDVTDPNDDVLISDDLVFGVLVQPSKRRLVLWRLAELEAGPGQEDLEAEVPSDKDGCDDDQFLNSPADLYVEGQKVDATVLAAAEIFGQGRDVDQSRSRFLLRFSFLTTKAVVLSGSLLAAGTEMGTLVCLDLNQFKEYGKYDHLSFIIY